MDNELSFIYLIPPNTNVIFFESGIIERSNIMISEHKVVFDGSVSIINSIKEKFVHKKNSIVLYPGKGSSFNAYDAGWYEYWPSCQNRTSLEAQLSLLESLRYSVLALPMREAEGFCEVLEFIDADEIIFKQILNQLRNTD